MTVSYNSTVSRRLGSSAAGQDCQWRAATPASAPLPLCHCSDSPPPLPPSPASPRIPPPPPTRPKQSPLPIGSGAGPLRRSMASGARPRPAPRLGGCAYVRGSEDAAGAFAAASASIVSLGPPARLPRPAWPRRLGPLGDGRSARLVSCGAACAFGGSASPRAAGEAVRARQATGAFGELVDAEELNGSLSRPLERAMAQ